MVFAFLRGRERGRGLHTGERAAAGRNDVMTCRDAASMPQLGVPTVLHREGVQGMTAVLG